MSEPRLATGLWVAALLRRVHAAGDFATVLHRGDDTAGSVVLVHRHRHAVRRAIARAIGSDQRYHWRSIVEDDSVNSWIEGQRRFDVDLWVVELDTPDLARFIDETID